MFAVNLVNNAIIIEQAIQKGEIKFLIRDKADDIRNEEKSHDTT